VPLVLQYKRSEFCPYDTKYINTTWLVFVNDNVFLVGRQLNFMQYFTYAGLILSTTALFIRLGDESNDVPNADIT